MKAAFVAIDILTVFFAGSLAITLGSGFQPNVASFLVSFFVLRTGLLWLFFNSFVHRDLPWLRAIVQFVILILVLPVLLFLGSFVPFISGLISSNINFYYILIPLVVALISSGFQFFFKLESWQA